MERIPEDVTGTYWSGQQKAKVTSDHVTFTLVDAWGNLYKRVYAPVGTGSGTDPFAQPDGNGVYVVEINHDTLTLTYLDSMLKNVSPGLEYEMYTLDTQFVFMPTDIFTVPAVIGSPATGRVPTYQFIVNLEGHLITFTLGTSYLSPLPFPDFSHSPSTNMVDTTGANSARSATGSEGAANNGTTTRKWNIGQLYGDTLSATVNAGAAAATDDANAAYYKSLADYYKTLPKDQQVTVASQKGALNAQINSMSGILPQNLNPRFKPRYRGGAFERQDFYNDMQGLGYRGNPEGEYVPIPYTPPSSMRSAPMIIGGVSVMALLLLLAR